MGVRGEEIYLPKLRKTLLCILEVNSVSVLKERVIALRFLISKLKLHLPPIEIGGKQMKKAGDLACFFHLLKP